ncbi:MAG: DNA-processing protein DprA [Candidatus Omnitrophota bacterium]|nr:DNA-processing protein DprA [Candidatus Omnitrophota bacterium]
MAHLEDYILLNMVEGLGFKRLESLLKFYGEPSCILNAPRGELATVEGVGNVIAEKITSLKKKELDRELKLMEKRGVYAISVFDANYPRNLKNSYSPPIVIYVRGEIKPEDADAVALVGSRMPSHYGVATCERLSSDLTSRGITVVSGMARGIDTAAHTGALRSGRTIAVLGSGLNQVYPPENKKLADEICGKGAVISEFPMNTPPNRFNFPRRNRVISGLSLGVIVIEAGEKSGALITANFALEENREVFAVPGRIDSKVSTGTNNLLKEGAKLVERAEDIIEEIQSSLKYYSEGRGKAKEESPLRDEHSPRGEAEGLSGEEKSMKNLLSYDPIYIDELAQKSNMSVDRVASLLVRLEIKNLIKELPGKNFILK